MSWGDFLFIIFSFWWIDKALANAKKEQDEKLKDIAEKIDSLHQDFAEKFN